MYDFNYQRASSVADATTKHKAAEDARFLAGGMTLLPVLKQRLDQPSDVVDLADVKDLVGISEENGAIVIKAMTKHHDVEHSDLVKSKIPALAELAGTIGDPMVRNRGTIGGSLAHADPAADWPLALAALDAVLEVRGPQGRRRIEADRLLIAPFTTSLTENEVIVSVLVPRAPADMRWGYYKLCRKAGEFPMASVAIAASGGTCRVFLGALPDKPRPLPLLAKALAETGATRVTPAALAEAVAHAAPDIDAIDQRIYVACLSRAIQQAFGP